MSPKLLAPLTLLLLTSCEHPGTSGMTTASAATSATTAVALAPATVTVRVPDPTAACAVWKPVLWSGKDTDDTIRQVKVQNAAWKALCGPRP